MDKDIEKKKEYYKIIISELNDNPTRKIKLCFALMGIIPFLILFYILIGKNRLYVLFTGTDGFIIGISVLISVMGFFVAYALIANMTNKLLLYFVERKIADQEKLELLSGFTHDLKTPLTIIKAGIQNMIDGMGGAISKVHRETAHMCLNAVNRATNFINQMLDISKLKLSMMSFKRELIDFEQIVKDEIREISALAKKNNQEVHCQIASTDPTLWGDKDKLSRAVMNLLSNAVKYTNVSGRIDVILSSDNDAVHLAVINTGSGIPADKLDKIFDKYERLHSDSKIEGTGLGLSIVKDIIDMHKGHITVRSTADEKTEFNIVFPKDLRLMKKASSLAVM